MPGYLTHAKVLIDTVDWLSDVEHVLQKRVADKKKLTPLEQTVLERARTARQFLRYAPNAVEFAPERPASIDATDSLKKAGKAGIGDGISQYAFSGSLGVDFPAAAHILAINQRWVSRTLHWGSPKRPWVKAGSTRFVFNALDHVIALPGAPKSKPLVPAPLTPGVAPLTAAVLGHCVSVATHVVLHPFISYVQSKEATLTHFDVETALDAQLAIGFFQREDLQSGQSWTAYYLNKTEDWPPFFQLYLAAFNQTYQGPLPAETICALPPLDTMKKEVEGLEKLLQQFPEAEKSLRRYQGYRKLFDSLPEVTRAVAKKEFDAAEKVKDFLEDYPCRTPKLDVEFMEDGWRNTVRWAIDVGYDKSPGNFRWMWAALLTVEGVVLVLRRVNALQSFSTLIEFLSGGKFTHEESAGIKQRNREDWEKDGLANPDLILNCIDKSLDPGLVFNPFFYFGKLMTGVGPWDGIFGQGTETFKEASTGDNIWLVGGVGYEIVKGVMEEIWPKFTESLEFGLPVFVADFVIEVLDVWKFGKRDEEKGEEGDLFEQELWKLQMMRWPFLFTSLMMVLGIKATNRGDGQTEIDYNFRDFLISLTGPVLASAVLVFWKNQFEQRFIGLTGVRWPTDDTKAIQPYLKVGEADKLKVLQPGADKIHVQLFPPARLERPVGATNLVHPEDKEWDAFPADGSGADSVPISQTLLDLFDRTKYLSGLLAMTAANYVYDTPANRTKARDIFDDWNLDYRTQLEWEALMQDAAGQRPGLLQATDTWWKDIQAGRPSEREILNRMQDVFGVSRTTGAGKGKKVSLLYEDGTPMRNAEFEAVFGDTKVPGWTDSDGVAIIDAPGEHVDSYQLFLVSYPQQVREA